METLQERLSDEELRQLSYWMIDNADDQVNEKYLVAYSEILRLRTIESQYLALKETILRG